jgi:aldose 1-epimerase
MMPREFGTGPDGLAVPLWTLENGSGMRVTSMRYGAALVSIDVPDRAGRVADVALGFDTLDAYRTHRGCLGAVVGRFANRIAHGRFTLDGRTYQLATKPNGHHIHGGTKGFDKVFWTGEATANGRSVTFSYVSPDGEESYPGTCRVSVTYTLTDQNALVVDYQAVTDAPTPINLSQHAYFNLAGHDAGDVGGHRVTLNAEAFTAVDADSIPTGEIRAVVGTPLDFRSARAIGDRIDDPYEQLQIARGYDHNFVLDRSVRSVGADAGTSLDLVLAARVHEPVSGRTLEVQTTEPGVQFYTGNSLDGSQIGKGGHAYGRRSGFCLETQHFPNSPNIPSFPSTILRPGERFRSCTVLAFGVA